MPFHPSLCAALTIPKGVTAVIGGGGKTTLLYALAEELRATGSVLLGATARMYPPAHLPVVKNALGAAMCLKKHPVVYVGETVKEGKLTLKAALRDLIPLADYILLEADGSRTNPLKIHAAHEPCIPPEAAHVVAVMGLSAVGRSIKEAGHRPQALAAFLGVLEDHLITPADAARVLCSYARRDVTLLNQCDVPGGLEAGRAIAALLPGTVAIAALLRGEILEVWKEGRLC